MKVNVTFSMDLDEIPEEIRKRLNTLKLKYASKLIDFEGVSKNLSENQYSKTLDGITRIRESLMETDQILSECGLILAQHQKALAELYIAKEDNAPQKPKEENIIITSQEKEKEDDTLDTD